MMINPMFNILRESLFKGEALFIPEWEYVFKEMKEQTIAALPGNWLIRHLNSRAITRTGRSIEANGVWTVFVWGYK